MATLSTTCNAPACEHPGCVCLEGHELCRAHFIAHCYERLEEYGLQLGKNDHWQMVSSENFVDILSEIIDQATTLGLESPDLDGIHQAQLLDILFTAGNLLKNLRRSIRRYLSVPLRLCYEVSGREWKEETNTLEVSQHGACVESRLPISKGEILSLERTDNHRTVKAKVRWHRRKPDGSQMLGIELLDSGDFWGFDKPETESPQTG